MLAHSNGQQSGNPHEAASAGSASTDASGAASGPSVGAAPPQQPSVDDANDGDLTDIDLGPPSDAAATPEPDDPVPLSTPLRGVGLRDSLSNGAVATPQPRPAAEASSTSSPAEDPQEIVLGGGGLQSITLTTYEDSVSLPPGAATAGHQACRVTHTMRSAGMHVVRCSVSGPAQTSTVQQAAGALLLINAQVMTEANGPACVMRSSWTTSRWTGGCGTRGRAAEGRRTAHATCRRRQLSARCRRPRVPRLTSCLARPSGRQLTSSSG